MKHDFGPSVNDAITCHRCGFSVVTGVYSDDCPLPAEKKSVDTVRVFVGMDREPWEEFFQKRSGAYVACSCGHVLQIVEEVRRHWQEGHFDTPVYRKTITDRAANTLTRLYRNAFARGTNHDMTEATDLAGVMRACGLMPEPLE